MDRTTRAEIVLVRRSPSYWPSPPRGLSHSTPRHLTVYDFLWPSFLILSQIESAKKVIYHLISRARDSGFRLR